MRGVQACQAANSHLAVFSTGPAQLTLSGFSSSFTFKAFIKLIFAHQMLLCDVLAAPVSW